MTVEEPEVIDNVLTDDPVLRKKRLQVFAGVLSEHIPRAYAGITPETLDKMVSSSREEQDRIFWRLKATGKLSDFAENEDQFDQMLKGIPKEQIFGKQKVAQPVVPVQSSPVETEVVPTNPIPDEAVPIQQETTTPGEAIQPQIPVQEQPIQQQVQPTEDIGYVPEEAGMFARLATSPFVQSVANTVRGFFSDKTGIEGDKKPHFDGSPLANYEQAQADHREADKKLRAAQDENIAALKSRDGGALGYHPEKEEPFRAELLAKKTKADEALKNAGPSLDKIVEDAYKNSDKSKFMDFNSSTKKKIVDVGKIENLARNIAKDAGLPETGYAHSLIANKLKAYVAHKQIEPKIEALYPKVFKELNGSLPSEVTQKEFDAYVKDHTKIEAAKQEADFAMGAISKQLAGEAGVKQKELSETYKKLVDQLSQQSASDPEIANHSKQQMAHFQELVNAGKMTVEQATKELNNSVNGLSKSKYGPQYANAYQQYLNELNAHNTKYNARYRRQAQEIVDLANAKIKAEADKAQETFKASPQTIAKIKAAYQETYKRVLSDKDLKEFKTDQSLSTVANFSNAFLSSFGAAVKGVATTLGMPDLAHFGDLMENNFAPSSAKTESVKDLFDATKFSTSFGNLMGRMTPGIVASGAVAAATQGAGLPMVAGMALSGLTAAAAETMDMAGTIHNEVLAETGSAVKAGNAAREIVKGQMILLPTYALEGLPFFGNALKGVKNVGLRALTGAGIEFGTEMVQEVPQNAMEESIKSGGDLSETLQNITIERIGDTALQMAPVALLGGSPILFNASKDAIQKNWADRAAKAYSAKTVLSSELNEENQSQFISQIFNEKGAAFSKALITTLFASGKINQQQNDQLSAFVDNYEKWVPIAKKAGMNSIGAKIGGQLFNDLETARKNNDAEGVALAESALDKWVNHGEADLVGVVLPDGSTYDYKIQDFTKLLDKPEFQDLVRNGEVKLANYSQDEDWNTYMNDKYNQIMKGPAPVPPVTPTPEPDKSKKERRKIVVNHLLDNDGDVDGAFGAAGYVNINGIWVSPESTEYVKKVSETVWEHLKKSGVRFIEGGDDGRGLQQTVVYGKKNIRGIGINENVGDHHSGHNHTMLHELAHHVWQEELTPEQRLVFQDDSPVSDYAKSVKSGNEKTLAKHDEEDFAELYARNNGDVNAAIAEKKKSIVEPEKLITPNGKPLSQEEIDELPEEKKWKKIAGPDSNLSELNLKEGDTVIHNGNGQTFTVRPTGEKLDGEDEFELTNTKTGQTRLMGQLPQFQLLNTKENGSEDKKPSNKKKSQKAESVPVADSGSGDGVASPPSVKPGTKGSFSPKQRTEIRDAIPSSPIGWARKYFLDGGKVRTSSASKEVTGLREGKSSQDVIRGIIGSHNDKEDTPSVERVAEIIMEQASEAGIQIDDTELRNAVIDAISEGKGSWYENQAKEVLAPEQQIPEGFELDFHFPKQDREVPTVKPYKELSPDENQKLTQFVTERIPGGISKDGIIALTKLQGVAERAAMDEVLGEELAAKVADLPVDTLQESDEEGSVGVGGDVESISKALEKAIPKNEAFAFAINTLPIQGTINYKDIKQADYALPFERYVNSPDKIDKEIASAYKIYEFLKKGGKLPNNVILLDKNGKILDGNNRVKAQLALGITDFKYAIANDKIFKQSNYKTIAEAYHKAKKDGSNPELVKAVEQSLKETTKAETKPPVVPPPVPPPAPKQEKRKERDAAVDAEAQRLIDEINAAIRESMGGANTGINPKVLGPAMQLLALKTKQGVLKISDLLEDLAEMGVDLTEDLIRGIKAGYNAYRGDEQTPEDISDQMDDEKSVKKYQFVKKESDDETGKNPGSGNSGPGNGNNRGDAGEKQEGAERDKPSGSEKMDDKPDKPTGEGKGDVPGGRNESAGGTGAGNAGNSGPGLNDANEQHNFVYPPNFRENQNKTFSKTKAYAQNIAALEVVLDLVKEPNTYATDEQKQILSEYNGLGPLVEVLLENSSEFSDSNRKYEAASREIRRLLEEIGKATGLANPIEALKTAENSKLTAYFTQLPVIRAIWEGIKEAGFSGGRVLEGSVGSGRFIGGMPTDLMGNSRIRGVEMDVVSSLVAKYLYPKATITNSTIQKASVPSGAYDVFVSNIPFGDMPVYDPVFKARGGEWAKSMVRLHNYYIAKAIDSVRPGGYVALVTTANVLDKKGNADLRAFIEHEADFVGAVRLPASTFNADAGTQVITDIIMLRRKLTPGAPSESKISGISSVVAPHKNSTGQPQAVSYNSYFDANKENLFGEFRSGGLYSGDSDGYTLLGDVDPEKITQRLKEMVVHYPMLKKAVSKEETLETLQISSVHGRTIAGGVIMHDGKLFRVTEFKPNGEATIEEIKSTLLPAKADMPKAGAFIELKRAYFDVLAKDKLGEDATAERAKLKKAYDHFVKVLKPGTILGLAKGKNNLSRILESDPDFYSVTALQKENGEMADIITRPISTKQEELERTDDALDAIALSINKFGNINLAFIQKVMGLSSQEEALNKLGDNIFESPDGQVLTKEAYLSGNVREKLFQAKKWAEVDPGKYKRNVDALEKVIPEDIVTIGGDQGVTAQLGASWIPLPVYQDFIDSIFGPNKIKLKYQPLTDQYTFDGAGTVSDPNYTGVGDNESRRLDTTLKAAFSKSLSMLTRTETLPGGKTITIQLPELTQDVRNKVERLETEFTEFLKGDQHSQKIVVRKYNDLYNNIVNRLYNGQKLTFPGMVGYELHPHQKDAIMMLIENMGGMIDHQVGAGKSIVMGVGSIKMKRLGLINKPMIATLKSVVPNMLADIKSQYPDAKILAPRENDFKPANRQALFAKIINNDWDLIILTHENLASIPLPADFETEFLQNEVIEMEAALREVAASSDGGLLSSKKLTAIQKKIDAKKARIEALQDKGEFVSRLDLGEMGIDFTIIDESQYFKNLGFISAMNSVSGLGTPKGSGRAENLKMVTRYMQRLHGGDKGVVFASGTPISNSLSELYNIFQFLRPSLLKTMGINSLDQFIKSFAVVSTEFESGVTNTYKQKSRLREFVNIPELSKMYTEISDVRTEHNLKLPKPEIKGGKTELIVVPQSKTIARINRAIMKSAKKKTLAPLGKIGIPYTENAEKAMSLFLTGINAKMAIDPRMIFNSMPQDGGKIPVVVDKVFDIWKETAENRGVQMIFSDIGTPKKKDAPIGERVQDAMVDAYGQEFIDQYSGAEEAFKIKDVEKLHAKLMEVFELEKEEADAVLQDALDVTSFNVYKEIKDQLIAKGVPENEIAFIHDAPTQAKKDELYAKLKNGDIRIILGSTQKMGTGVSVQRKIVAMHHLDIPWRPSDMEQRNGRGIRQGNTNKEVAIYAYGTEGTLDAYKFSLLAIKQKGIDSFRAGSFNGRTMTFDDGENLSMAEYAAILSGDERPLRIEQLKKEIQKLEIRVNSAERSNIIRKNRIESSARALDAATRRQERIAADAAKIESAITRDEKGEMTSFNITLGDRDYTVNVVDKKESHGIFERYSSLIKTIPTGTDRVIGNIGGVPIRVTMDTHRKNIASSNGTRTASIALNDILLVNSLESFENAEFTGSNLVGSLKRLDKTTENAKYAVDLATKADAEAKSAKEVVVDYSLRDKASELKIELADIINQLKQEEKDADKNKDEEDDDENDDFDYSIDSPSSNNPSRQEYITRLASAMVFRMNSMMGTTAALITDPYEIDQIKALPGFGANIKIPKGKEILGFVHNGNIYVDPRVATEKTAIHEPAHIWLNWLEQTQPLMLNQGLALVEKENKYINRAKQVVNSNNPLQIKKEALVLAIADEGKDAMHVTNRVRIKQFLNRMYEKIGQFFFIKLSPAEISNLTFKEFVKAGAYAITNGPTDLIDTQDPVNQRFLDNLKKRVLKGVRMDTFMSTVKSLFTGISKLWLSYPYLIGKNFGEHKNILGQLKRALPAAIEIAKNQIALVYEGLNEDEIQLIANHVIAKTIKNDILDGIHNDLPVDVDIAFGITKENVDDVIDRQMQRINFNPEIEARIAFRKQIFDDLYDKAVALGLLPEKDMSRNDYFRRIRTDLIEQKYANTVAGVFKGIFGNGRSLLSTNRARTGTFNKRTVFRGDFYTNAVDVDMDALVLMNLGTSIRSAINDIKKIHQPEVLQTRLDAEKDVEASFGVAIGQSQKQVSRKLGKAAKTAIDKLIANLPAPPVDPNDAIDRHDYEIRASKASRKAADEFATEFLSSVNNLGGTTFGAYEKSMFGNVHEEVLLSAHKMLLDIGLRGMNDPAVIDLMANSVKGVAKRVNNRFMEAEIQKDFESKMAEKGWDSYYPEGFVNQIASTLMNNTGFDEADAEIQNIIQTQNIDADKARRAFGKAASRKGVELMWAPAEVVQTLLDLNPVKSQGWKGVSNLIKRFVKELKSLQLLNPFNIINYLWQNLAGNTIRFAEVGGKLADVKRGLESFMHATPEDRAFFVQRGLMNSGDFSNQYQPGMTGFETTSKALEEAIKEIQGARGPEEIMKAYLNLLKVRHIKLATDGYGKYLKMMVGADNFLTDVYRLGIYHKALEQIENGRIPNMGANINDLNSITDNRDKAAFAALKAFGDYSAASKLLSGAADYGILPYVRYMNTMVFQFYGNRLMNIYRRFGQDKGKPGNAARTAEEITKVMTGLLAASVIQTLLGYAILGDDDDEKEELTNKGGSGIPIGIQDKTGNNFMVRLGAPSNDQLRMLGIISAVNHAMAGAGGKITEEVMSDIIDETYGMVGPIVKVPYSIATQTNHLYDIGGDVPVYSNTEIATKGFVSNPTLRDGLLKPYSMFSEDEIEPTEELKDQLSKSTMVKKTNYTAIIQNKVRKLLEDENLVKALSPPTGTNEQKEFYETQRNMYKSLMLDQPEGFEQRLDKYMELSGNLKGFLEYADRKFPLSRVSKENQSAIIAFAFGGDGILKYPHGEPKFTSDVFSEEDRKLFRNSLELFADQNSIVNENLQKAIELYINKPDAK